MGAWDSIPTLAPGTVPTGAQLAAITGMLQAMPDEQCIVKPTTQSYVSQTTFQADIDFIFPVVANATYEFDGFLLYSTVAAALFKCTWTVPAGASGTWCNNGFPSSVTAAGSGILQQAPTGITTGNVLGTNGGQCSFSPRGTLFVGATSGFLQFQHAQSVSTASTTSLNAQSHLSLKRVA